MSEPRLLTPVQRRIVATALTALALMVLVAAVALVFGALRWAVTTFSSVLWPIAVAIIISVLLRPVVLGFQRLLKTSRTVAVVTIYSLVVILLLGAAALIVPALIDQLVNAVELTPELLTNLRSTVEARFPTLIAALDEQLGQGGVLALLPEEFSSERLFAASGSAVSNVSVWILKVSAIATGLGIIPVYLFYFLLGDQDNPFELEPHLSFLGDSLREDVLFLIHEFLGALVTFFRGQIIIGLIMGVLMAIGFTVVGLRFGLVLGLVIGLINIVPYLGTILGLATTLPVAYLQPEGGMWLVGLTLLVFVVVQLIEGYLLTPRILGDATGLHPVTIIIAIFFWGSALNGILGLILAIPLTAFFVVFWRLFRKKYLEPGLWGPRPDHSVVDGKRPVVDDPAPE